MTASGIALPLSLRHALELGDCVLFVGAGVGEHLKRPDGSALPDAPALARELAVRFGMGTESDDLAKVAELLQIRAFWTGRGYPDPQGWALFGLVWLQSAASIVYAYLRLEQRALPGVPEFPLKFRMVRRALMYTTFNLTPGDGARHDRYPPTAATTTLLTA